MASTPTKIPTSSSSLGSGGQLDRKSTRLNSSHLGISYAVFCLKKKKRVHFAGDIRSDKRAKGRDCAERTTRAGGERTSHHSRRRSRDSENAAVSGGKQSAGRPP